LFLLVRIHYSGKGTWWSKATYLMEGEGRGRDKIQFPKMYFLQADPPPKFPPPPSGPFNCESIRGLIH
jgi:hypothetical protein